MFHVKRKDKLSHVFPFCENITRHVLLLICSLILLLMTQCWIGWFPPKYPIEYVYNDILTKTSTVNVTQRNRSDLNSLQISCNLSVTQSVVAFVNLDLLLIDAASCATGVQQSMVPYVERHLERNVRKIHG